MKKKLIFFIAAIVMLSMFVNAVHAHAIKNHTEPPNVEFTEKQKQELSTIYKELFKLKKELTDKYQEFGAITDEKAEKMKSWMDKHYKKIEENGFQPMHKHYRGHMDKGKDQDQEE